MKLLTRELMKKIPPLYSQDGKGDEAVVYAKFFTPDSSWTWYVTEASAIWLDEEGNETALPLSEMDSEDYADVLFFGLVDGLECELGYFSLRELESVRGPLGLPIERDVCWEPVALKEVRR